MRSVQSERRASQLDVAKRAGVSRSTVSFVINDVADAGISQDTRERVWAAARELGFRPNQLARGLRSNKSNVLGLITQEIASTPYAVAIIRGAQDSAQRHGKTLLIIDTDGAPAAADDAVMRMKQWQVEGLILATEHHRELTLPASLDATPVVLADCFTAGDRVPCIVPDERQGGRLAAQTLLAAGHRRIGFINGPNSYPASAGRLRGYLDAHKAYRAKVDERLIRTGDWWQESATNHTSELLDLPDPPTALFCANDWMAMGAYDAIKERGLRIPADIAVIGFDNREEIAAHMRPTLTSVALPYHAMGQRAVEYLLGGPAMRHVGKLKLECPLVRRDSA